MSPELLPLAHTRSSGERDYDVCVWAIPAAASVVDAFWTRWENISAQGELRNLGKLRVPAAFVKGAPCTYIYVERASKRNLHEGVSFSCAAGWPNLVMSSSSRKLLGANGHIGPFDTCIMRSPGCRATKSQIGKQPSRCAPAVGDRICREREENPRRPWKSIFKRSGREF